MFLFLLPGGRRLSERQCVWGPVWRSFTIGPHKQLINALTFIWLALQTVSATSAFSSPSFFLSPSLFFLSFLSIHFMSLLSQHCTSLSFSPPSLSSSFSCSHPPSLLLSTSVFITLASLFLKISVAFLWCKVRVVLRLAYQNNKTQRKELKKKYKFCRWDKKTKSTQQAISKEKKTEKKKNWLA